MRVIHIFRTADIMPFDEWRALSLSIVDAEVARIDVEEAEEKLQIAKCKLAAAEAVVKFNATKYGVGK